MNEPKRPMVIVLDPVTAIAEQTRRLEERLYLEPPPSPGPAAEEYLDALAVAGLWPHSRGLEP